MSNKNSKEIERKWLLKSVPPNLKDGERIIQGYVTISPDGTEVRVRNKNNKYFLTIKSSGLLERNEVEIEITNNHFNNLWVFVNNKSLEKTRYKIFFQGKIIEIDIYSGKLKGLAVAEVEFNTITASKRFIPPEWFGKEVTFIKKYKNKNLALLK